MIENVFKGVGRKCLGEEFEKQCKSAKKISDSTSADSAYLAYKMISAAAKTTETVPAPAGIGGEIKVLLLSKDETSPIKTLVPGKDFRTE